MNLIYEGSMIQREKKLSKPQPNHNSKRNLNLKLGLKRLLLFTPTPHHTTHPNTNSTSTRNKGLSGLIFYMRLHLTKLTTTSWAELGLSPGWSLVQAGALFRAKLKAIYLQVGTKMSLSLVLTSIPFLCG